MWRATVIERVLDGRVVVSIPALYRGDPIGPMQSAVDAQVGDAVVVADLVAESRVTDWWVVGYESQIGRWGAPYPHEHPIGQVSGLVDALALKADVADIPGAPDTSGYATKEELAGYTTDAELTTALSSYATTTALNAKAAAPGAWVNCSMSTYLVLDVAGRDTGVQVRATPHGTQMRGRVRVATAAPLDAVVFTLPAGFAVTSPTLISVPTMGPASGYASLAYGFEVQVNGTVTAREAFAAGARLSFNTTLVV